MPKTSHWLISGRVQGVSFRWFTRQEASRLGLVGTVRNLSDGRVEVFVTGPSEDLETLRRKLLEGPRGSHVQSIDEASVGPAERALVESLSDFEITL